MLAEEVNKPRLQPLKDPLKKVSKEEMDRYWEKRKQEALNAIPGLMQAIPATISWQSMAACE